MNQSQSFLQQIDIINLSNENDNNNALNASISNPYLGRWAELPFNILEKTYSYLDKSDQLNMSLVCKNWSHEYGSPCLWKYVCFDLSKMHPGSIIWPEVKIARKFGSMLKHIEIKGQWRLRGKCWELREMEENGGKAFIQMQLFIDTIVLLKCQLISIKFTNICDYSKYFQEKNFKDGVLFFVKSQHNLQTIEFTNCLFTSEESQSFPRLICESTAITLSTLILKAKDDSGKISKDLILRYGIHLENLINLKILKTDYTINFENMLDKFCDKIRNPNEMTKKLSLFELHCNGSKLESVKGILPETWLHLQHICPHLKVYLDLVYTEENYLHFIFVKSMPLVHLTFQIKKAPEFGVMDLKTLIQHLWLCESTEVLEYLNIVWHPAEENVSIDLIPFLEACKKLKNFQITISYPVSGLEALLEWASLNTVESLESVLFTILVTDEEGWNFITLQVEKYNPLLQNIGQILLKYSS